MPHREKIWTRSFVILCLSNFFMFMPIYITATTFPLYVQEGLHGNMQQMGLAMTIFVLGNIAVRPFSGRWVDRFGSKKVAVAGAAAFLLACVCYFGFKGLMLFLFVRLLHGMSYAVVATASSAVAAELVPATRGGEGMGYFSMFMSVAMVIGPALGLYVWEERNFNLLILVTCVFSALALLFAVGVRMPLRTASQAAKPEAAAAYSAADRAAQVEEARVQEARVEDARVQEARVQEARVEDARVQEARVQEARVQEAQVKEAQVQEARVKEARVEEAPVRGASAEQARRRQRWREYVETKAVPIGIAGFILAFSYSSITGFIAAFTNDIGQPGIASYFFVVFAVMIVLSRPIVGKIFDKYNEHFIVYPGMALYFIGMIVLSQAHSGPAILTSSVFMGVGFGALLPSYMTLAMKLAPVHRRGVATGTFFLLFDCGYGIGAYFMGLIAHFANYRTMFGASVAVIALSAVFYYLLHHRPLSASFRPAPAIRRKSKTA